jgi:hypothetical protein
MSKSNSSNANRVDKTPKKHGLNRTHREREGSGLATSTTAQRLEIPFPHSPIESPLCSKTDIEREEIEKAIDVKRPKDTRVYENRFLFFHHQKPTTKKGQQHKPTKHKLASLREAALYFCGIWKIKVAD